LGIVEGFTIEDLFPRSGNTENNMILHYRNDKLKRPKVRACPCEAYDKLDKGQVSRIRRLSCQSACERARCHNQMLHGSFPPTTHKPAPLSHLMLRVCACVCVSR
jgi:hypothetical protein